MVKMVKLSLLVTQVMPDCNAGAILDCNNPVTIRLLNTPDCNNSVTILEAKYMI